ncbi:ParB/RepB/Spo0J family partition protein [Aporhodopirellula aestuarii]|uniref:ParB/RepB/Spo0J family partition protein n=1 Tax=Aporhodopirellula aestuarii TaxID=2950107 RepID=A0ABT0U0I5_9BACT|nr:ParB/RepB/Spo0J family partition protein [Aporhodopirellula aestuarii]MCM2370381.1 ParB/RepB/Spo0J family partition protein [Aporhodopirellula aestuarii]
MNENKYSPRYQRPKLAAALQHAASLVGKVHPMCNALPVISARDFDNLVDSIKENGLLEPVYVNRDKQLLDGRSRLMACLVAGVTVTADHVEVTDHSPEAISQSNVARRHLTENQKLMRAADRLASQRKHAADRQAAGAEKGRERQKQPAGAKLATNQKSKKRSPRALEKVAKEEKVPRADLALAEKVVQAVPKLKARIESGELSLDDAADLAGVPRKQPKASRPKKQKSSRLHQDLDVVTDHGGGIRELTAPGVSVFAHPELDVSIMVYGPGSDKYIGATNDEEHVAVNPDTPLVEQAIDLLKRKLTQIPQA